MSPDQKTSVMAAVIEDIEVNGLEDEDRKAYHNKRNKGGEVIGDIDNS